MNNYYPLVSIFTTTYNKFEQIGRTIDSVFSQDYPNIEYIITDDGSIDFPEEEIREHIEGINRGGVAYHIIHHKKNLGTVKNLNFAYKSATGMFFINLACGDAFFDETVVSRIVDRFLTTKCDVLVATRILFKGDFEPICMLPHYKEREIITKKQTGREQYEAFLTSRFYDMASGSAMYFTRSIMLRLNYFDEKYILWEDGPFLAKFLQVGKLEFAYDIVSTWYETGGISSDRIDKDNKHSAISKSKELLRRDLEVFNETERTENINTFSMFQRRMIKYRIYRLKYRSSIVKYLLYLIYLPELLSSLWYSYNRKKRSGADIRIINDYLEGEKYAND